MIRDQRPVAGAEERLGKGLEEIDGRPRLRAAVTFATTLCGGLAAILLFFVLIGTVDPTEAVGLTVAVVVFALIWFVAFWSRHARADERRVDWRNRERRGF